MFFEKQILINQLNLDTHILFLIKDYIFESVFVRDKNIRYKERNLYYLSERINIKTDVFEMGETDEIIEMPNMVYENIDNEYEQMTLYLNEWWLSVEEEIVLLWNKYAIQREKNPKNKELLFLRDSDIDELLTKASIYDANCWYNCRDNIIMYIENFDMEIIPFKDVYFMCLQGRDIYTRHFLEDGRSTLFRTGILDKDNDTILIDRHSWWKEIQVGVGQFCSVNPSTNAIYKHWSYKKANIIGVLYKNDIILF